MILADTSTWVEYDRATGSVVHRRVAELIASDGPLSVTEPVIMEVLAGARSDQRKLDLPRRWVYSARDGGLHDRSGGVAPRRGCVARAGCGPAARGADRWPRAGPTVAADLSNC